MEVSKIHKEREEMLNFCKRHSNVYLYGAGVAAKFMLRYLQEENIRLAGILVSDGHRKEEQVNGYRVFEVSEVDFHDYDGVILGVNMDYRSEIKKILLERGMKTEQIYDQDIYNCNCVPSVRYESLLRGKLEDDLSETGYFSAYKELDEIGVKYDTDKAGWMHNYLNKYEFFLKGWKTKPFQLLELGVFNGASLKMWEEFFPDAEVYGVDIDESCKQYNGERRNVIIMDLGDTDNLEKLKSLSPSVIIDDASHMCSHQIKALFSLFPVLPEGGIYIIEDLETSFEAYQEFLYNDSNVSAYEVCSQLAKIVCGQEVIKEKDTPVGVWLLRNELQDLAMQIEMISFIHGACIMIKK